MMAESDTGKSASRNVFQCIAEVQSKLAKSGISKDRTNEQQRYKFRGIDDVYNALSSTMADVGLVILPSYETRDQTERESKAGGILFNVTVKGTYKFVSSHDGTLIDAGPFWGEAMDSADKATNKAMSAAYKYMAMQVFAIPTEGDNDADSTTHVVTSKALPKAPITPTTGVLDQLPVEMQKKIEYTARTIIDAFAKPDDAEAFQLYNDAKEVLDTDEQVALRGCLPSHVKSTLRKMAEAQKQESLRAMS